MFEYSDNGLVLKQPKLKKEQEDFFQIMDWRIRRERSNIIILVGEQGSGKSNTGLYLVDYCNRTYYNRQLVFDDHVYNNIFRFVRNFKNLRNCYCLLEEMGIELNSKDWRHTTNRVFRDIIETFRIKKVNLVLTLPNLCDLDKSTRYLSHFIIKMLYPGEAIIFRKKASFITDKIWYAPVWEFNDIPSVEEINPELWNKYDTWHHEYIDNKNKEWLEELTFQKLKKNYKKEWYKQRTGGTGLKMEATN